MAGHQDRPHAAETARDDIVQRMERLPPEALGRDFTWVHNPGLAGWERGDLTTTYVEISADEAERIIERFKAKWESED